MCFKITFKVSVSHPIWKMLLSDKIPSSVPTAQDVEENAASEYIYLGML